MALLAPLWWPWYTALYIYSHSWALGVSIATISTIYLVYRHRLANGERASSRPKIARVVTKHATIIQEVEQVLPVHPHNGWCLSCVSHGLRVFSRFFPSLGVADTSCLAATTIINVSPKKLLSIATSGRDIPCWLEGVSMAPQYIQQPRGSAHYDADIIQLSYQQRWHRQSAPAVVLDYLRHHTVQFTQKYAMFLDGIIRESTRCTTETFEREWTMGGDGRGQVCWVARQPSQLPYHWSMLVFSPSVKEKSQTIATLVMLPKSPDTQSLTSALLTAQLISLKDFSCLRRARVYSHNTNSSASTYPPLPTTGQSGGGEIVSCVLPDSLGRGSGKQSSITVMKDPPVTKPVDQVSTRVMQDSRQLIPNGPLAATFSLPNSPSASSNTQQERDARPPSSSILNSPPPISPLAPSPPTSPLNTRYTQLGREACEKLIQASEATEQEGWITLGINKNVLVMKKPPQKGEASVNCVKGTGIVKAPPEFVFRVVRNKSTNCKLDDMLKETRLVEQISDTTRFVHLLFKSVWPTAPRDFTAISMAGRYDNTTLISAGVSIADARVPEEKGYVRGNIVCGGYVIKESSGEPDQCKVTYVSQAELRGSIPTFAVNKVTESQPQCVARLRGLAEELYTTLKDDPQKMKEFEEAVNVCPIHSSLAPPPSEPLTSVTADSGDPPVDSVGGASETAGDITRELSTGEGDERDRGEGNVREVGGHKALQSREGNGLSNKDTGETRVLERSESWTIVVTPPPGSPANGGEEEGREGRGGNGMLVMEALQAYTPDEITTDDEEGEGEDGRSGGGDVRLGERQQDGEKGEEGEEGEEEGEERIRFEKKLQPYPLSPASPSELSDHETESLTEDSIAFPRQESGGVDFRTLGNQTAARVLEELFHVSSLDVENPSLFNNESSGWKVIGVEKEIVILKKKTPGTPFLSFMGKGLVELPPQKVYDSVRNPQLRFTYDNMLKELHSVKHIEDGLYVLHIHHETTQCFIKQSRDFCILANEREEGNKLLLVGLSVDIPECPVNPNITRAKITYSGWVVEPYKVKGRTISIVTYLLQVDLGGIPATLVNYVSKRQPLAIAYLRDYLTTTSLQTQSL